MMFDTPSVPFLGLSSNRNIGQLMTPTVRDIVVKYNLAACAMRDALKNVLEQHDELNYASAQAHFFAYKTSTLPVC